MSTYARNYASEYVCVCVYKRERVCVCVSAAVYKRMRV